MYFNLQIFIMKNIFLLTSFFLVFNISFCQDLKKQFAKKTTNFYRWSFSTSYGFASYRTLRSTFNMPNAPHSVFEFAFDYNLKNNASFGVSFMKSTMNNTYNKIYQYDIAGNSFQFSFENFQNLISRNIYEVHYRNFYLNQKLNTSIGLYVFNDKTNNYDLLQIVGENYYYFGVTFAVAYQYPIKEYFHIGINIRSLFSLDGTDFMASPFIKFSF